MRSSLVAHLRAATLASALAASGACALQPRPAAAVPAQSEASQRGQALRQQVIELLDRGAEPKQWAALGKEAVQLLQQIFCDPSTPPNRRAAALEALGRIGTEDAWGALVAIARDARLSPEDRGAAAEALARAGRQAAVADLAPLLEDANEQVRAIVARALSGIGGEDARAALEERVGHEESPQMRELFQHCLTKMQP